MAKGNCSEILNKNADYLLVVKGNQGRLEQAFDTYFDMSMLQKHDGDSYSTQETSHRKQETRLTLTNIDLNVLGDLAFDWRELKNNGYRRFHKARRIGGKRVRNHGEILH